MFRQSGYLGIVVMMGLATFAQAGPSYPLQLDSISPPSGNPGAAVRLNGRNFGASAAGKQVVIRHQSAFSRSMVIRSWSDRAIVAVVPADAMPGANTIAILNPPGIPGPVNASGHAPFTVLKRLKLPGIGTSPRLITAPVKTTLPGATGLLRCPDPAAHRIDFRLLSKTSPFAGRVMITGVVKNLGGPYETRPNQQQMLLYEDNRMVASAPFSNLASGQEVSVSFQRNWNRSSPAEGEFPPTYKLIISYDPDITLDGNKQNDDCGNNNTKTRSGVDINRLF